MDNPDETARVVCEVSIGNGDNGDSAPQDTSQTPEEKIYFDGPTTGALLVAGRPEENDQNLFLRDVEAMGVKLQDLGIPNSNIFSVTPNDRGRQLNNIKRAVEDLTDYGIKNFIFFYAGHCTKEHKFSITIDSRSNQQQFLCEVDLKACLHQLPANKMLLILDTCYSGGIDMGARGGEEEEEQGAVGGAAQMDPGKPDVPCLWDIFDKVDEGGRGGNGSGNNGADGHKVDQQADKQAVQWCACSADEKSYNFLSENGLFTNGILRCIDEMVHGSEKSVLDMHQWVKRDIKTRQICVLKPDGVCEEASDCWKTFPRMRKNLG